MKILILSCNTGGGHNSAAKAIKEAFDEKNQECVIEDALAFGGQAASDLVCDGYLGMVKRTPKLFGEIYKMGSARTPHSDNLKSPIYVINKIYADALNEYIIENNFDAIICVHVFPLEALTHLKRKHNLKVPVYFVATDYEYVPLLNETLPDAVFAPHDDSVISYVLKGIPQDKIMATGIPVSKKFTSPVNKAEAREKLGFSEKEKTVLIMCGSMGFGSVLETAKMIYSMTDSNTKVVVITGNNKRLFRKFEKEFEDKSRLVLLGFTDQVPLYMSACDLLLTKPGGLSSTEALVRGIPMIHTSPIPGCETENADFFQQHHLSVCVKTSEEAAKLTIKLLKDDFLRNQILEAQKHYRYTDSARKIAETVLNKTMFAKA